jgi:FdhD protein
VRPWSAARSTASEVGAEIATRIAAPKLVERAALHGLTLAAIARHDTVTLFTAPERLTKA